MSAVIGSDDFPRKGYLGYTLPCLKGDGWTLVACKVSDIFHPVFLAVEDYRKSGSAVMKHTSAI